MTPCSPDKTHPLLPGCTRGRPRGSKTLARHHTTRATPGRCRRRPWWWRPPGRRRRQGRGRARPDGPKSRGGRHHRAARGGGDVRRRTAGGGKGHGGAPREQSLSGGGGWRWAREPGGVQAATWFTGGGAGLLGLGRRRWWPKATGAGFWRRRRSQRSRGRQPWWWRCGLDLVPTWPDLLCWVSFTSQLSGERQQRCGRKSLPARGGRWRWLRVLGHVGEGGRSVRVAGVPQHFDHDDEVLRWWRCEQCGCLPHSGGLRGRCAATRTKVLPIFGLCRRRQRPWVLFPSLEASPRCADTPLALSPVWLMSPGESLGLEWDWRDDGGVLDVDITLLGASHLETRRGGSRLPSSSACRCPWLFFRGAMHASVGESKMIPSRGRPSSTIRLL
jgi:hypothetical protein